MRFLIFIHLLTLTCFSLFQPVSSIAAGIDNTMPGSPVKLVFIHHSTGGNWLADSNSGQPWGALGTALKNNNYYVSATNYGWGPHGIGDRTDIINWPEWFTGENSSEILSALYAETGQNIGGFGDWSRMAADPGGENTIVMFKSCYPNSDLYGNPGDPPQSAPDGSYTVANAKAVYNNILTYFSTRTDKLFVVITAPPQVENAYSPDILTPSQRAANARAFNNWLVNDWLDGYPHSNVAVFDYFNVLTGPDNHHRWNVSAPEHTTPGNSNFSYYPNGEWDSHPSSAGQQKATMEFVDLLNYFYNRWQAGSTGSEVRLYYPHIASNTTWETEVCLINKSGTTTLTGTLKAYSDSGALVDSLPVSLPPNGRIQYAVGSDFALPHTIGYMIFEASTGSGCGYMKFYVDDRYRGAIPAANQANQSTVHISHIASNTNWWTGLSLLNTTAAPLNMTITFSTGTTRTVTLFGYEHRSFSIKSLFSGQAQPTIKWARITNAAGMVGLELFGSSSESGNHYLSGVLLKDVAATRLYYPHVSSGDKWWTGITAFNTAASGADLTITPFRSDGTPLTARTLVIEGSSKYVGSAKSLGFAPETAWFSIQSTQPLTGFELFGTLDGRQLGGYTGVNISQTRGVFPKLDPGGWTGIAFVNTSDTRARVTLTARPDTGSSTAVSTLDLAPYEKRVGQAGTFFSPRIDGATCISFESDQPIVGFQLNGSDDNMLLDALPGL